MVAIAAVHHRLASLNGRLKGVATKNGEKDENFEIKQYNKALRGLRKHISANGVTIEVTLTCCILLICLEFLRGRVEQAILHLRGGFTILEATEQHAHPPTAPFHFQNLSSNSSEITRKLKDMFTRLRLQWDLFSGAEGFENEKFSSVHQITLTSPFSSLEEARSSLAKILGLSLRFIQSSLSKFYSRCSAEKYTTTKIDPLETHAWMMAQFSDWSRNFEAYMATQNANSDMKFLNGSALLRMQHLAGEIWHSTVLSPRETIYDAAYQQFSSLILLASSLTWDVEAKPTILGMANEASFSFTFEMGAIAPLYFTAVSCRDRKIRRQAIELLACCLPRREGLWDADLLGFVAGRVVEIEETRLPPYATSSSRLPEERDRIIDVKIGRKSEEGRDIFTVTYILKPDIESENFLFRREEIVAGDDGGYRLAREEIATLKLENGRNEEPRFTRVEEVDDREVVSCYGIIVGSEISRCLRIEVGRV